MAEPDDLERNRFSGRFRRYSRVGTSVGGMAARMALGRMFGIDVDKEEHARELYAALGGLKGPVMKVGQILATIPDAIPEEYARELQKLQTEAPSMGWAFVRRRMAAELGPDWQKRFKEFERIAAKAASLGQVHRAVSLDGEPLACKIQYPDMSSTVEADLSQLKFFFRLYRQYDKAIDPSLIHEELSERLREELDYEREARNIDLYRHMLRDEAGVHVPMVHHDLTTRRLISMSWLEGESILDAVEHDLEARNAIALNMFRCWYVPFYHYGVIHGDPHLGNYSVRDDNTVNLLDFGCIRIFQPKFVRGVIDLYKSFRDDDEELAVHAYETWGFVNLDRKVINILNQWARYLYQPLLEDKVQTIQHHESGVRYGAGVAAKVHRELREVGGVRPPREFVLVDRAAIGLGSVFTHLQAEINWHRQFHELIDTFDEKTLAKRQKEALDACGIAAPPG